jgi:recombination protein RecA
MKTIAANQAMNPEYHTLWVASEEINIPWANQLGMDTNKVTFVMSNVMELCYDAVLSVLDERVVDAVVIDSYPALVPSEEDDKSMMELTVGRGAYLTNKFMRKSYAALSRSLTEYDRPVMALFINQWRERIGVFQGNPRTTPGGKGKNYSFLTRIDVAREEWITGPNRTKVGQVLKFQALKNKTAPPQRVGNVDYYFDAHKQFAAGSYDNTKEVHAVAMALDLIEHKGGGNYYWRDYHWRGEAKVIEAIEADPALAAALDAEVRFVLLGTPLPTPPPKRRSVKRVA